MSDLPHTSFHIGDSTVGPPVTSLNGAIFWIPEPSGFDALHRVNGPVGRFLKNKAAEVEMLARGFAPVDTGDLQRSIGTTYGKYEEGIYAEVGTDLFYAPFQEFGTSNGVPPHPFLRPALAAAFEDVFSGSGFMEGGSVSDFGGAFEGTEGRFDWDPGSESWDEI